MQCRPVAYLIFGLNSAGHDSQNVIGAFGCHHDSPAHLEQSLTRLERFNHAFSATTFWWAFYL